MSEEMWTELEKVDILCDRLNLTYEEARNALQMANGDVIKALADCEREKALDEGTVGRVWDSTKNRVNHLWQTQMKLKHNDRTVFSISAPLGIAIGYMVWRRPALRVLGLVGAVAAVMQNYELELESMMDLEDFDPSYYPVYETVHNGQEGSVIQ